MTELKDLMRRKEEGRHGTGKGSSSRENLDPGCESPPAYGRQTLIRPQLTNPRTFWSKSEDEGFSSSDQKYKTIRNDVLEEKLKNLFKPIRSDVSPGSKTTMTTSTTTKSGKTASRKGKGGHHGSKQEEKSIHESLRIQRVKRRTSLPFSWSDKGQQQANADMDGHQDRMAEDKTKTYDIGYYSTVMKRVTKESEGDYSRTTTGHRKSVVKSASDECIYDDGRPATLPKEPYTGQQDRLSVTEPSSPFTSSNSYDVTRPPDRYADSDSESTGSDRHVADMKKSKSFAEDKTTDCYGRRVRSKVSGQGAKSSVSSPSSCDYSYRGQTVWKVQKSSRPDMTDTEPKVQDHVRDVKQVGESQHDGTGSGKKVRKRRDVERVKRPDGRNHSVDGLTDVEAVKRPDINPDIFQHLLDVLTQRNRSKGGDTTAELLFTKSLPRRLKQSDRGLKAFGPGAQFAQTHVADLRHGSDGSGDGDGYRRRRRDGGDLETRGGGGRRRSGGSFKPDGDVREVSLSATRCPRPKKKVEEECVIQIEDKKLWIEICKAVEKVDARGKKMKKCV